MTGQRLLHKYRVLTALRARREELQHQGIDRFDAAEGARRRAAFRELAAEFPGALRELDVTPAAVLSARAEELERALAAGALPAWAEVAIAYHAALREALAVKRWIAEHLPRGGVAGESLVAELRAWHAAWPHRTGPLPGDVPAFVERHIRPPGGRVHALVWEALEARLGRGRAELEALLFWRPPPD